VNYCKECHWVIEPDHEWWVDWAGKVSAFCSRDCASFFVATQEAEDLAYVKRSLGMAVCDG
jgi:hypothetical protein